mmetsp:Transcript_9420/g.28211  ORF Transcript_9420/g.28211 Transcript_9420/m.28211 type:complete len:154 (+) Transcript_9420:134-595(+)|eukprot:CAMPEP_0119262928 /NCGR_PEP_ID=MMETSP1329-20130426/2492_1 /TAXON_ID=114041 /ORGANISM="Genus nov. species nov., Strain RCC1024" /LENGTH=153 /DNA_ID=CAMNT_0007262611 /DNA_START=113 /DNA_END=574 /DNA_ORIENTATION=-
MAALRSITLLAAAAAAFTLPARRVSAPALTRRHAETAELTPEEKTANEIANRKKISNALASATKARDKEQLRIALAAAEQAGGFSSTDETIRNAVVAYNELSELSDTMRSRLVAEAKSQGGDPNVDWNPGNAYIGIFALMTVLVIAGGKDIFY